VGWGLHEWQLSSSKALLKQIQIMLVMNMQFKMCPWCRSRCLELFISRILLLFLTFPPLFCNRPTAKLSAKGLESTFWPHHPTLTTLSKMPIMTHLMSTEHEWWHEWHDSTCVDMNDMIWPEWQELDMDDMIWHEWHDLTLFDMYYMTWHE
jgi:hypothetical protein